MFQRAKVIQRFYILEESGKEVELKRSTFHLFHLHKIWHAKKRRGGSTLPGVHLALREIKRFAYPLAGMWMPVGYPLSWLTLYYRVRKFMFSQMAILRLSELMKPSILEALEIFLMVSSDTGGQLFFSSHCVI